MPAPIRDSVTALPALLLLTALGFASRCPAQEAPANGAPSGAEARAGRAAGVPATPEELAKITARVLRTDAQAIGTTLVEVELENRTALHFEPTVFEARWIEDDRPQEAVVRRVPHPRVARAGRSVPPRRRELFWLQVPSAEARELGLRVIEGLLARDPAASTCPVEVGAIHDDHAEYLGQRVPSCSLELHNTAVHPVDLILLAECTAPRDGRVLLTASLRAGARGRFPFRMLPLSLDWVEGGAAYPGLRIEAVRVVDWSARLEPDLEAGRAAFAPAYASWLRWPEPAPPLRGRFVVDDRMHLGGGTLRAAGTFVVTRSGGIEAVTTEGPEGAGDVDDFARRIRDALSDLERPDAEALANRHRFVRVDPERVRLEGPGWDAFLMNPGADDVQGLSGEESALRPPRPTYPAYRLRDGRLAGELHGEGLTEAIWETRPLGPGYVVTHRSFNHGGQKVWYRYELLGELAVLTELHEIWYDALGAVLRDERLRLVDWHDGEQVEDRQGEVPTGPDAEALRAAWDRIYRYPTTAVRLDAGFRVTSPGNDEVWLRERKVEGELHLTDFIGLRWARSSWSDAQVELEGNRGVIANEAIASAVLDRIGMWRGRDPAAFEEFELQFRGTTIRRDEARGAFVIEGGPLREIRVADGLVTSITIGSGIVREYGWKKLGDRFVAVRIRTGEETIEARWTPLADGWMLPTRMEFRRVFGKDWGPETLELFRVRIE